MRMSQAGRLVKSAAAADGSVSLRMRQQRIHGWVSYWQLSTVKDGDGYLAQTRQERDNAQVVLKSVASNLCVRLGVRVG